MCNNILCENLIVFFVFFPVKKMINSLLNGVLKNLGLYSNEVVEYFNRNTCSYTGPFIFYGKIKNGKIITPDYEYIGEVYHSGNYCMYGRGICTYNNGMIYEGNFVSNNLEGHGKITKNNEIICEGIFDGGNLINGYYIFEGNKVEGITDRIWSNWTGKITSEAGDIFTGNFTTNGIFTKITDKKGILKKANGDIIIGEWLSNKLWGKDCTITYSNGDTYIGSMCLDEYDEGILTKNGILFKGKWTCLINEKHFAGEVNYPNGDVYIGLCINDKRNGKGNLISGDILYCCNWKDDLKNGDGYVLTGEIKTYKTWRNDMEITEEQSLKIKCPECRKDLNFLLSECKIHQTNQRSDEICQLCMSNICNINLPCQHRYCDNCIKLVKN